METKKEFLQKLKALLQEYNASISWGCDSCSDMHGVTGEHMSVCLGDVEIKNIPYASYVDSRNI